MKNRTGDTSWREFGLAQPLATILQQKAVKWLANDWHCSVIRAAMGVQIEITIMKIHNLHCNALLR